MPTEALAPTATGADADGIDDGNAAAAGDAGTAPQGPVEDESERKYAAAEQEAEAAVAELEAAAAAAAAADAPEAAEPEGCAA